jgi:transcriptional regulator with XRE-family HTH domain
MPATETDRTVGDLIRGAMALRGILQRDLATALNITQTQVSARLRGEIDWRLTELQTVARVCHVELADLAGAPADFRPETTAPAGAA